MLNAGAYMNTDTGRLLKIVPVGTLVSHSERAAYGVTHFVLRVG